MGFAFDSCALGPNTFGLLRFASSMELAITSMSEYWVSLEQLSKLHAMPRRLWMAPGYSFGGGAVRR